MARKPLGCLAIVALLAAAGAFAYGRFFRSSELTPAAAAELIPADSPGTLHVNTRADDWSRLDELGTPAARQLLGDRLSEFETSALGAAELDYGEDIAPWLGNVTVAQLPSSDALPEPDNNVAILGIRDKGAALRFAASLEKRDTVARTETRRYEGTDITTVTTADDTTSFALVSDNIVVASNARAIERVIDTARGGPALADRPDAALFANDALGLDAPLVRVFIADPAAALAAGPDTPTDLPAGTRDRLADLDAIAVGVAAEADGLRLRVIAVAPELPEPLPVATGEIVARLPADTIAFASGRGLDRVWSTASIRADADPQASQAFAAARTALQENLGLDLDRDVFGWMTGEYAIALVPTDAATIPNGNIGAALLIGSNGRSTGENTLAQVDRLVSRSPLRQRTTTVGGVAVTEWLAPPSQLLAARGWLPGDLLAIAVGMPLTELTEVADGGLAGDPTFRATVENLPRENFGYVYADVQRARAVQLPQVPPQPLSPEADAALDSVQAIAVTVSQPEPNRTQLDLFAAIAPAP